MITRDAALTILAFYTDPDSPERSIARGMLQGHSSPALEASARNLASALRARLPASVEWARADFLSVGEEHGLVPREVPGLGRVVMH